MLFFVENYYKNLSWQVGKYYLFLARIFGQTWQKQPSCWNRNLKVNFKLV
jgi:hypothetical protein